MPFHNLETSQYRPGRYGSQAITCDEKFSNVKAAVNVDLTAAKYGLRTLDFVA